MPKVDSSEVFDLVLTPQLYILKKSDLPIKYSFQAKKIAPSILEEFATKELEYEVFRDGDFWFFIGYDKDELQELIYQKGLSPSQIGKIYFAQQFKEQLKEHPLILSDKEALIVIDDIVTFTPLSFLEDKSTISVDFLKKPKKSFSSKLQTKSKLKSLDFKSAVYLVVIFTVFGLSWWIDGLKANAAYSKLEAELNSQIEKYPSLESSITRKSILKKYQTIDKKQRAIREFLKGVGKLITADSKVISLKIDTKNATAVISVKRGYLNRIKNLAKKIGFKVFSKSNTTVVVQKAI